MILFESIFCFRTLPPSIPPSLFAFKHPWKDIPRQGSENKVCLQTSGVVMNSRQSVPTAHGLTQITTSLPCLLGLFHGHKVYWFDWLLIGSSSSEYPVISTGCKTQWTRERGITFPAEFWPNGIHFLITGYLLVWYILKQLFDVRIIETISSVCYNALAPHEKHTMQVGGKQNNSFSVNLRVCFPLFINSRFPAHKFPAHKFPDLPPALRLKR